jgi:hypothetical protein
LCGLLCFSALIWHILDLEAGLEPEPEELHTPFRKDHPSQNVASMVCHSPKPFLFRDPLLSYVIYIPGSIVNHDHVVVPNRINTQQAGRRILTKLFYHSPHNRTILSS